MLAQKGRSLLTKSSVVEEERAYPTMCVVGGSSSVQNSPYSAGKVFFLARSPEAPNTTTVREE